jgi:hypothetical protein
MAALTDRRLLWFWGRELRELQLSQVREVRAASSYNTEIRMGWSYVIFTATDREVGVALPDGEDQTWLASAIDILGRKAQGAA